MNASSEVLQHAAAPEHPAASLVSLWSSFFVAILVAAAVDVCYISRPKVRSVSLVGLVGVYLWVLKRFKG